MMFPTGTLKNTAHQSLVERYDVPAPRYTSYPTVPHWSNWAKEAWERTVTDAWAGGNKLLSLYVHLPFCESLCTYCACNTRITKRHEVEEPYVMRVLQEWAMYLDLLGETPRVGELHLGGGTPTFFSPANLAALIDGLQSSALFLPDAALSFEAHPANTTHEHLEVLAGRGFQRISLGVQDFDPHVQRLIHRHQTPAQVNALTTLARLLGYKSINYDLIYGLPDQTIAGISDTVKKVIDMRPDRIAFYSYAHVPWMRPGQRAYTEANLPTGHDKRRLYETGRALLEAAGYTEIGLDHFALPGDELLLAAQTGKLHRNFMGYTAKKTSLLLGLGASAISDAGTMYAQNEKTVEGWNKAIDAGQLPSFRGHELSRTDLVMREHILNIMCKGKTSWAQLSEQCDELPAAIARLREMEADGLVKLNAASVEVLPAGRPFLRNAGACFDTYFQQTQRERVYSTTA